LQRFIGGVVTCEYDGSENEALTTGVRLLGPRTAAQLLTAIGRENMPLFHCACVNLLSRVVRELGEELTGDWPTALREVATVMVGGLSHLQRPADPDASATWQRVQKAKPVDAAMVADLLTVCARWAQARPGDAAAIVAGVSADPGKIVVPALTLLQRRERKAFAADAAAGRMWVHAAEFSWRAANNRPHHRPTGSWRRPFPATADCRELQKFANDSRRRWRDSVCAGSPPASARAD
jgi:hypothetical protein